MTSRAALRARLWKAIVVPLATVLLVVGGAVSPSDADDLHSLSGHVYLGSTSVSAGEGEVIVRWRTESYSAYTQQVTTDAAGNYLIPNLRGSYLLEFNYVGAGAFSSVSYPNYAIGTLESRVNVSSADVIGIDAVLAAKASIRGTVRLGASATPAGAGEVLVSYQQRTNLGGYTPMSAPVPTDASGSYELAQLGTGLYRLFFDYVGSGDYYDVHYKSTSEGVYWQVAASDIGFAGGADRTATDMTMPAPSTVSGRVFLGTTATPATAGSVEVALRYYAPYSSTPVAGPTGVTDATGAFAITGVHQGEYDLVYTHVGAGTLHVPFTSTKRSLNPNENATASNVTLLPTYAVSGDVDLGQSGIPAGAGEVTVTLKRSFSAVTFTTATDASGHYSISGVPAGDYDLSFTYVGDGQYRDYTVPGTHSTGGSLHTQVVGSRTFDVVLELGNGLSGSVVDTAGAALEGVAVYAVQFDPYSGDYVDEFSTLSDGGGGYTFRALPDGIYRVDFEREGFASQSWAQTSYYYDPDLLELDNGSITGGVNALLYHGGTIRGFVGGDAVTNNPWTLVQLELQVLDTESGEWRFADFTNAGSSWMDRGRYEFTDLPPDTYRVVVNFGMTGLHTRVQSPSIPLNEGQTQLYFGGVYPGEFLEFGTLVKSPWVDTVYLANEDNLVRIGSMAAVADLGLSTSVVTASNVTIDAYYPLINPLSSIVSCNGRDYVASKGVLTEVDPELVRSVPSTTLGSNCVGHLDFSADYVEGALFLGPDASGRVYSIRDGQRHFAPVAADRAALAAPFAVKIFPVNNAYVQRIPTGIPDISSGRLVKASTSSTTYVINGDDLIPTTSATAADAGIPGQVFTLTPAEIALYSLGSPLSNLVDCAGTLYLAAQGKLSPVSSSAVGSLATSALTPELCALLPKVARPAGTPVIVQSASTARIYVIAGGVKRQVPSVASVRTPSNGTAPKAMVVNEAWLSVVPTGAAIGSRPPLPLGASVPPPSAAAPFARPAAESEPTSAPATAPTRWYRHLWRIV